MKRVQVGFVAKRTEDGRFVEDRPIFRDVPDSDICASGLTKCEERCLKRVADSVFAELARDNPQFREILGKR